MVVVYASYPFRIEGETIKEIVVRESTETQSRVEDANEFYKKQCHV